MPDETPSNAATAAKITQLRNEGILQQLEAFQAESTEDLFADVDMEKVRFFLDNPEQVLAQIAREENGEAQLAVIDALLNEGTVNDVLQAMEALSPETAIEMDKALDDLAKALEISNGEVTLNRSLAASTASDATPNIRNMKLRLSKPPMVTSPALTIFAPDMRWDTVGWYIGFCAITVLGCYATKSWMPWVKIAGLIAAGVGAGLMIAQLIMWRDSKELWDTWVAFAKKDEGTIINILNTSEDATQIFTVSAVTLASGAAIYFTPVGRFIKTKIESLWKGFLSKISDILPGGIKWEINGVKIPNKPTIQNPTVSVPSKPSKRPWWKVLFGIR